MFQKTKLKKSYISAIGMSLVLLLVNTLGLLLSTGVGQITPPSTDVWSNYTTRPSGSGTSESSPYEINNARELAYLIDNLGAGSWYISLNSDIDLAEHEWEPIKIKAQNSVVFRGNGHTISNLKINQPNKRYVGFFEGRNATFTVGGDIEVTDVNFSNVNVVAQANVGTVIGSCNEKKVVLKNVNVLSGSVSALGSTGEYAGGLMGDNQPNYKAQSVIENCVNNANVFSRGNRVGGLIAYAWRGVTIRNCINTGNVEGKKDVGGFIGGLSDDCRIENCYAECEVLGESSIGGIAAFNCLAQIFDSGFNGVIKVQGAEPVEIGSMVGRDEYSITNSFGIAEIYLKNTEDTSCINIFGAPSNSNFISTYSYSKVITSDEMKEFRKCKYNAEETEPFSEMAYHKNINGGFPFPKTLFAVGQFIDSDVLDYLEEYGFSKFSYPFYKKGDSYYVELGMYPQTYVGDELNNTLKSLYAQVSPNPMDSYTNDTGASGTVTHYVYAYIGKMYVRVASAKVYDSNGYKTQDGSTTLMPNQEYWFNIEPIKWLVLNYEEVRKGAMPIVISEQGLTSNVTWNKSTSDQNLWASKSNIRTWLNSTFYNDAFSEVKDDIQTTTVKNNSSSSYVDGSGTTTNDNVWLLSYGEAGGGTAGQYSENRYFNDSPSRLCSPTDYALVNNCFMYVNASYPTEIRKNGGSCNWLLRSAYTSNTYNAQFVNYYGNLNNIYVNNYYSAVRPALTLNI